MAIYRELATDQNVTWYMHVLEDHLQDFTNILYKQFGLGYGVITTQSMEHMLKQMKRELRDHTLKNNKWHLVLLHLFQRKYGWFGLREASCTKSCGACGKPGHIASNKLCDEYKKKPKKKNNEEEEE